MKFARGERKLIGICAFALAVPLGAAAFIGHLNATPAIPATSHGPAPQPNGYDLYVQAARMIKTANPPVDASVDGKLIKDPKVRAQRYSLQRKDAWLAQNRAGFALFERAQKADSLAPPFYQSGRNSPPGALGQMSRYKFIQSNAHWQRGDHAAALQSGLDILQMGRDVQFGGGLYDFIAGQGFVTHSLRATGDTIEHLDATQARDGARRIEKLLARRWTFEQALAEDLARSQQDWLRAFERPNWRDEVFQYRPRFGGPVTLQERWSARTVSKRRIIADLNEIYARAIANSRLDYGLEAAPPHELDNVFLQSTPGWLALYRFSNTRAQTSQRILMLRLALRAHQLERGAPPADLQALVPNYVQAVPVDPFGKGAPLRHQTDGKTYKLWSLGPDGVDDGGTPVPWFNPKRARNLYADERERLPYVNDDSRGDYVAGRNH